MKKIYINEVAPAVKATYNRFHNQQGAEHIASLGSMQVIFDILHSLQPKTILEFGAGIGTLTYFCLENCQAQVDLYEDNAFCLAKLKENLSRFKGRYYLFTDYENFRSLPHKSYDLVIVDGGPYRLFPEILNSLDNIRVVFFEGRRFKAQQMFRQALKKRYSFKVSRYVSSHSKCGYKMVCRQNKNSFLRFFSYCYNYLICLADQLRVRGWKMKKI